MRPLEHPTASAPGATTPQRSPGRTAAIAALALLVLPIAVGCSKQSSSGGGAAPAASADDKVIARVNGAEIRESELAFADDEIGGELQQLPPPARREQLINYLITLTLVSRAAETKNLGDGAEFKQ